MNDFYVLAIETSCDETSASIVKNGNEELGTVVLSQMDIHKQYGGVVPEIASRYHVENITLILEELLEQAKMKMEDINAIGVTYGPGLVGSLLIGLQAAKTLAFIYKKPLIPVHHIAGHIYANKLVKNFEFPLLALVVSGGHTDIIYMNEEYSFERIGHTLDDAVGEAYDKVAKLMQLDYPGGPIVDNLASIGECSYRLPTPLDDNSYNFSFSGLKSAVINLIHNEEQKRNEIRREDLAASFQKIVVDILVKKTIRAAKEYQVKQLLLAGGVAANKGLRLALKQACEQENIELITPPINYCTDNAAMIAVAAYYAYKKEIKTDLTLDVEATIELS